MFWKKKKPEVHPWRPSLVAKIEDWMTNPLSSTDKIREGLYLSLEVLETTLDMAWHRKAYYDRLALEGRLPARERPGNDDER